MLQSFVRRPHEPTHVPPSVHPEVSVLLSRCLDLQQQNLRPRLGHRLQPPLWDQVSEKQKQVPQRSRPEHLSRSHPPPWVRDGPPLAAVYSPATSVSPLSVRFCCGPSLVGGRACRSRVLKSEVRTLLSLSGCSHTLDLCRDLLLRFSGSWSQVPRNPGGGPACPRRKSGQATGRGRP